MKLTIRRLAPLSLLLVLAGVAAGRTKRSAGKYSGAKSGPGLPSRPGRRICVIGTSGAGKTFVAEALAARLGLRYINNDAIIWRPEWQPAPRDEVYADLDGATREEGWTFDGNLGPSREDQLMLARCDTLVWLDLPRSTVFSSIIHRTLARAITRKPLWHGNQERWRTVLSRDSMIWWSIKTFARRRRVYGAMFREPLHARRIRIRLRSRKEVNRWLESLNPVPTPT